MGRISGYGWSLGYVGGVITLVLCLIFVQWSTGRGMSQQSAIAGMIAAVVFALAAMPTFLWLRERAVPHRQSRLVSRPITEVFTRLARSLREVRAFPDLARLLISITIYQSGVITVVVLAAVYAQEVMGFDTEKLLLLIIIVDDLPSALGAFLFGYFQDRVSYIAAVSLSLAIWVIAVGIACFAEQERDLWIVGNLIGLAMGASQWIWSVLPSSASSRR